MNRHDELRQLESKAADRFIDYLGNLIFMG